MSGLLRGQYDALVLAEIRKLRAALGLEGPCPDTISALAACSREVRLLRKRLDWAEGLP